VARIRKILKQRQTPWIEIPIMAPLTGAGLHSGWHLVRPAQIASRKTSL
jgi:hypothetical protein